LAKSHPARPDFTLDYRLFGQSIAPRTQEKRYASDDELKRGLFNRLLGDGDTMRVPGNAGDAPIPTKGRIALRVQSRAVQ
jgi:hypothetical protein